MFVHSLQLVHSGVSTHGASSGSAAVTGSNPVVWNSTTAMVSDVQGWVDNPGSNNGWMVIGDEANLTTARRFDSSEGGSLPGWRLRSLAPPARAVRREVI